MKLVKGDGIRGPTGERPLTGAKPSADRAEAAAERRRGAYLCPHANCRAGYLFRKFSVFASSTIALPLNANDRGKAGDRYVFVSRVAT
jgi:hypothetical protein